MCQILTRNPRKKFPSFVSCAKNLRSHVQSSFPCSYSYITARKCDKQAGSPTHLSPVCLSTSGYQHVYECVYPEERSAWSWVEVVRIAVFVKSVVVDVEQHLNTTTTSSWLPYSQAPRPSWLFHKRLWNSCLIRGLSRGQHVTPVHQHFVRRGQRSGGRWRTKDFTLLFFVLSLPNPRPPALS